MKTIFTKLLSITAMAVALLLSACDLEDLKDALEADVPLELRKSYTIALNEGDPSTLSRTETFSTSTSGLTISDVELNDLTIQIDNWVSDVDPDVTTLTISFEGGPSTSIPSSDLGAFSGTGPIDMTGFDGFLRSQWEDFLLANPQVTVKADVETNAIPVSFDIEIYMKVTVTGTPE